MQHLRVLNLPQRIVLVIAWAGFLSLVAVYVITKGFSGPIGGWFAYAPNTGVIFANEDRLGAAASWFVWLAALVVWTAGSVWLLGLRDRTTSASAMTPSRPQPQ